MTNITLTVTKSKVYEEVAKITSYTGVKKVGDNGAYDRILTTDEDKDLLERFWSEAKNTVCNNLKKALSEDEESSSGEYAISLNLSSSFDTQLTDSMQSSLFSFFAISITAKWFAFTNKDEAANYAAEASVYMDDIMRKVFYKKKPVRPIYN